MSGIFVSYRRADAATEAGRLRDNLVSRFGADHIFQDVDSIDPGQRFAGVIDEALQSCKVFIAVIGPNWLTAADGGGKRRLEDERDWVRIEIARALARDGVTVMPVLVHGAALPRREDLPDDIKPLVDLQVCELTDKKWTRDVQELLHVLETDLKIPAVGPVGQRSRLLGGWTSWLAAALILPIVALLITLAAFFVAVPDVRGKRQADAEAALQSQGGLKAAIFREDSAEPYGQVIWQNPAAGRHFVSTVNVGVSNGVPDLQKWVGIHVAIGENSGAGLAMATAMETALAIQRRPTALSARYLVEKSKLIDQTRGGATGTYLAAVVNAATRFGAPPEESWPYRDNEHALPPHKNWAQLDAEAAANKATVVRLSSYDEIEKHIRLGHPVIAAVDILDEAWDRAAKTGEVDKLNGGRLVGRHSIVLTGYDSNFLRFANVWGKEWGDAGFGRMWHYDARAMLDLRDMWAVDVPSPSPSR